MKQQKIIDTVSTWYKTAGFYRDLVDFGFQTIKPFFKGNNLLEIGPADGAMTKLLTPHFSKLSLIEPSTLYVDLLRKQFPHATIHELFIEHFSPTETYDTIMMAHVLEHISQPIRALKQLKKAMHKGSRLIIIVPNANSLHRHVGVAMGLITKTAALHAYDKKLGHKRVYTRKLLDRHIRLAGLRILEAGGIMLKPLSNNQLASWDKKIINGLFLAGKEFPDLCAELFCVCTLRQAQG